ncbi:hypothetical protein ACFE04_008152 [Oxalis oulophora]
MRVIPIWASAILYHVAINQQGSFGVLQALQSDRRIKSIGYEVPAASFGVFQMISLTIWIPIYDRIMVPLLRKITGKEGGLTLLQRMGVGLFLTILALLVSASTEELRKHLALLEGAYISSMSAFWLIPQLAITGLAEGFNSVGQMEFYYSQLPENMRSVAGALYFCGIAVASYVDGFLISIVHHTSNGSKTGDWLAEDLNKGYLNYYFCLIAALGLLNFVYFSVCVYLYRYKGDGEKQVQLDINIVDKNLV